jgi:hypothetical protein
MASLPKHSTKHHGEPWYVAAMDRETCKAAVTAGDPGDFLIRDSSDGMKMVIVVGGRGPGETANYQIVPGPDFKYIVSGVPYTHVSEVLASMRSNHPNGNDVRIIFFFRFFGLYHDCAFLGFLSCLQISLCVWCWWVAIG